jgi:hypothetical protein
MVQTKLEVAKENGCDAVKVLLDRESVKQGG